MTTYVIVSVRDRAANAFGRPAFVPSIGVALRSFSDEVNRNAPDNQMFFHPEDFDMYELGRFDDDNGLFELSERPRQIAIGKDVKTST